MTEVTASILGGKSIEEKFSQTTAKIIALGMSGEMKLYEEDIREDIAWHLEHIVDAKAERMSMSREELFALWEAKYPDYKNLFDKRRELSMALFV